MSRSNADVKHRKNVSSLVKDEILKSGSRRKGIGEERIFAVTEASLKFIRAEHSRAQPKHKPSKNRNESAADDGLSARSWATCGRPKRNDGSMPRTQLAAACWEHVGQAKAAKPTLQLNDPPSIT
jgi:hypothetical protein